MNDYLPLAYRDFRATDPEVASTLDHLGQAADGAGRGSVVRLVEVW
jgi:hypothetical protein